MSIYPAFLNDRTMTPVNIEILFSFLDIENYYVDNVRANLPKYKLTLIVAAFAIAGGLGLSFFVDSIIEFAVAMILLGFGFSMFFPLTLKLF